MPGMGSSGVTGTGIFTVAQLVEHAQIRLGGLQNAMGDPSNKSLLSFLNEGKDEVWAVLKEQKDDYFEKSTQSNDASALNYFAALSTNTREYTLPADFQHMKLIEVLTSGYEDLRLVYLDHTSPKFQAARRSATANGTDTAVSELYYDIVGKNTLMLAQFPPVALTLRIWYVALLLDFTQDGTLSDFLLPYAKKIADFAVKKAMLPLQDQPNYEEWLKEWRASIIMLQAASPRNEADPVFVQDFEG